MTLTHEVLLNYTSQTSSLTYRIDNVLIASFSFHDGQVDVSARVGATLTKEECIRALDSLIEWDVQIARNFPSSLGPYVQTDYDTRVKKAFVGPPGTIKLIGKCDIASSQLTDFEFKTSDGICTFGPRDSISLFFNDGWRVWINFNRQILRELSRF